MHEKIDPVVLERRNTPEREALKEEEPSHEKKLEILYPRAVELVKAHESQIVARVEELIRRHGSYDNFPEGVAQDLADNVYGSGEVEMIEDIARVLEARQQKA